MGSHYVNVDNLISTIDRNGQQIDGTTEQVMKPGSLKEKFLAFHWEVLEADGNNMEEIVATLQKAKTFVGKGKPIIITMHTVMGKGVDFIENNHERHDSAPNADQYKKAMAELPETSWEIITAFLKLILRCMKKIVF